MTEPIIEVSGLGKRYRLGQYNAGSLREEVGRLFRKSERARPSGEFWALKGVSFSVAPGEVLGVIGRNGAGKSTLLKLLSRVTEPTCGEARIRGRIASLLEVGTGFHPELSGRENIFLNGAILGMTRAEIRAKFDEIVDFSGVAQFLDTPVKRYSSGMYVRLAFAVAAHLEPDVLIVDEVLAVGDAAFQEKCIGKMRDVSRDDGRTVLFVTHNMAVLQTLCERSLVLESGQIAFAGDTREAIRFYQRDRVRAAEVRESERWTRDGIGGARVNFVRIEDGSGHARTDFDMGEDMTIVIGLAFERPERNPIVGVNIVTEDGTLVTNCRSTHDGGELGVAEGTYECRVRIDRLPLYPRVYVVQPWIKDAANLAWFDWVRDAASFEVLSGGDLVRMTKSSSGRGLFHLPTTWEVRKTEPVAVEPLAQAVAP